MEPNMYQDEAAWLGRFKLHSLLTGQPVDKARHVVQAAEACKG